MQVVQFDKAESIPPFAMFASPSFAGGSFTVFTVCAIFAVTYHRKFKEVY